MNPPGNEDRGVAFFADLFAAEGIRYKTAESAPTRGNIWARLDGGRKPALVLLNHMDVVPADATYWMEKTPDHLLDVPALLRTFGPETRVVCTIRGAIRRAASYRSSPISATDQGSKIALRFSRSTS